MSPDIVAILAFGAGIFVGYIFAFAYIRIRDGRPSALKTREPGLDQVARDAR